MPSYRVASQPPPPPTPVAFLAVSLGIKPVCFCFNALCRWVRQMRQVKALLTVFDPLTETSGQTNCAEQQVQWSLSPMTKAFLFLLANFSSTLLLSHYAHAHPPSWIPQTCVTRSTTSTVCFSAQRHRLKFPGAQIISPTSLKTHEMLHRRTVPRSARLGAQTLLIRQAPP